MFEVWGRWSNAVESINYMAVNCGISIGIVHDKIIVLAVVKREEKKGV